MSHNIRAVIRTMEEGTVRIGRGGEADREMGDGQCLFLDVFLLCDFDARALQEAHSGVDVMQRLA